MNPVYKILRAPPKRASGDVCFALTFDHMDFGIPRKLASRDRYLKSRYVPRSVNALIGGATPNFGRSVGGVH